MVGDKLTNLLHLTELLIKMEVGSCSLLYPYILQIVYFDLFFVRS